MLVEAPPTTVWERLDYFTDEYFAVFTVGMFFLFSLVLPFALVYHGEPLPYTALAAVAAVGLGAILSKTVARVRVLNRRFEEIVTSLPAQAARGIAVAVAHDLDWFIVSNTKEYMRAVTKPTDFTWGQEITLVYESGCILFNCRDRGIFARAPFTLGWSRKHLGAFAERFGQIGAGQAQVGTST